MTPPLILAVETSCDETAVALLRGTGELLAAEVASQVDVHRAYGGVVPEVASRQHLRVWPAVLDRALATAGVSLDAVDAVAATLGPGLASSLMVGAAAAKGLALGLGKPFIGVNHLEGHLLSPFFPGEVRPAVGLVVSGGHTLLFDVAGFRQYRRLGGTVDDAAGEAFDKVAKLLGLPYPGGPEIDRLAARDGGDPTRFPLPRSMLHSGDAQFSFSGLKTAVRYLLPTLPEPWPLADLCASFQEAVVDVLVGKTLAAARATGRHTVAVSGGVSLNLRLRVRFQEACGRAGLELLLAPPALCTDNAAMIAYAAAPALAAGLTTALETDVDPNLPMPGVE